MPLARFHHFTLEVEDLARASSFWSAALMYGLSDHPEDPRRSVLTSPDVPSYIELVESGRPRQGSRRIHLDIHARSVAEILAAGGHVVDDGAHPWVVVHCPEHREIGVLLTEQDLPNRLYHLVLDSPDPEAAAAWWGRVFATTVRPVADDPDVAFIEPVPGAPFESLVFARESEPKTQPNSSWMTLTTYDTHALELAGATMLSRPKDPAVPALMADPDGNEFAVIRVAAEQS